MALGLGVLGLAPDAFWRMTLRELAAAVDGRLGSAQRDGPMAPADLARLMTQFPDRSEP